MVGIAEQGFCIDIAKDGSVTIEKGNFAGRLPCIGDFLPPAAQRHKEYICQDSTIRASPLPNSNTEKLEGHDLTRMFEYPHIEHIHTKHLSANSSKENKTCHKLSVFGNQATQLPSGFHYTMRQQLVTFSTNLHNIWAARKAQETKERTVLNAKKQSASRRSPRREIRHMSKYTNTVSGTSLPPMAKSEWQRRAELFYRTGAIMYKVHEKSRPPRPSTKTHQTQEINETREDVVDRLLKADIDEEYVVEALIHIGMQEEEEGAETAQQQAIN
ncbi:hypothetical protein DFQ29_008060 [Apophysomyces sp. BC1021]|nr:hypothetical protein DFQ29_008060 [Apophysomyces sp. BC1021]